MVCRDKSARCTYLTTEYGDVRHSRLRPFYASPAVHKAQITHNLSPLIIKENMTLPLQNQTILEFVAQFSNAEI